MPKLILGFVGEIASGKGTVCDYLIKNHHAGYHRFSTILRDILDRLHLEQSRTNLQQLSTALRQSLGEDLLARVMAAEVQADPAAIICVDGIRRLADIKYLQPLDNFHLIHITAEEKLRYERIIERTENVDDRKKSFAQFQTEQQQEAEALIAATAKFAQQTITNNRDKAHLFKQVDQLLDELQAAA